MLNGAKGMPNGANRSSAMTNGSPWGHLSHSIRLVSRIQIGEGRAVKQCFVESADDRLCWYRVSEGVPKQVVGHLVPRPRYGALNVTADQFLKTVLKIKVTIAVQGIGCSRQPAADTAERTSACDNRPTRSTLS